MRPDLLLDEDDKRKRFRKFHEPTQDSDTEVIEIGQVIISTDEEDAEDDDKEIQIVHDFLPNKRGASVALSKTERGNKKQNTKERKETKEYQPSSQTSTTASSSLKSLVQFRKGIADGCPSSF